MKIKKIVHLVGAIRLPRNPDKDGCSGVARASLELARAQAALGHQVTVASVGAEGWSAEWHGVHLVQLPQRSWARVSLGGRQVDFSVHLPYMLYLRQHHFDVIQAHMYPYLRFLRAGMRVNHFHNDPASMPLPVLWQSVDYSEAQVGVSQYVTQGLQLRAPHAYRAQTVYNGMDPAQFDASKWAAERTRLRAEWGATDKDVVFLYAGAVVSEKGVLELARAFARLSVHSPVPGGRVHLALAGDAGLWDMTVQPHAGAREYHAEVMKELEKVQPSGTVHVLGRIATRDMGGVYAACDVLTVPSYTETFSLAALEAMSSGLPVIGSQVGGLPEVIGMGAGLLTDPHDDRTLESAMRDLAADPEKRRTLGAQARQGVQHLTWEAAARAMDTIYQEGLKQEGLGG